MGNEEQVKVTDLDDALASLLDLSAYIGSADAALFDKWCDTLEQIEADLRERGATHQDDRDEDLEPEEGEG